MNLIINQKIYDLPDGATVADSITALAAKPPFAVAVNTVFIPKTQYTQHLLQTDDRVEIISPVTGG